jgi:hypothetical protein
MMDSSKHEGMEAPVKASTGPTGATTAEAAARLGCSERTLHNLRYFGAGPQPAKVNGRLVWDIDALLDWFATEAARHPGSLQNETLYEKYRGNLYRRRVKQRDAGLKRRKD